ncbi:MAG: SpoIIE family protein phosphatase [Bacteroidia bacterium]|nr:SpoIIE family protein phosphatase [Bacteroidia bacterium]
MRELLGLLLLSGLWAQPPAKERITALLSRAEEAPDAETEKWAREALSLLSRETLSSRDPNISLYLGQALDLLAYGLAYRGKIDSALFWGDSAYRLLYRTGHTQKAVEVKANVAYYLHQKGEILSALSAYREIASLAQAAGNQRLFFYTLNNLGGLFSEIGLQDTAALLYEKALKVADSLQEPRLQAFALNNLSALYETQRLYDYAKEYASKALYLRIRTGDSTHLPNILSNLGRISYIKGERDSALYFFRKARASAVATHNILGQATAATNLATFFLQESKWDSAEFYLRESYQLRAALSPVERFKAYRAWLHFYQRRVEGSQHNQKQTFLRNALYWLEKAQRQLDSTQVYDTEAVQQFYLHAHDVYAQLGDFRRALQFYRQYVRLRDSLQSRQAQRKAIESRYQYEWFQRERLFHEELLRQRLSSEEYRARQRLWKGFMATVVIILSGGGAGLYFLYRRTRQQRDFISRQKEILESSYLLIATQHEELQKSLRYAKRVQQALLPAEDRLKELFPFAQALWYQPRAEVGGDFYWVRSGGEQQFMLVSGDCTGHGVPGGLITALALTLLEQGAQRLVELRPTELVRFLHENFLRLFRVEEKNSFQEGIEGSFVWMDFGKAPLEIEILNAGAYAWWMPHGGDIVELEPTGGPVGGRLFSVGEAGWGVHRIPLSGGGRLILASDGVRDQLSPSQKKWGRKALREAVRETSSLPPPEALSVLQRKWDSFRGGFPQVDDILLWLLDISPLPNQVAQESPI